MPKYIFVTGGVSSSLGKGIASASLACLLEARGLKVNLQKFDPYLNVDPGTMNPYQHGEVYVTEDGAETDLDLGHYERFTNVTLDRDSNVTTGMIYHTVITKEREGGYLGKTVQIIPHITDAIKEKIKKVAKGKNLDVLIVEVGGTVGDIESLPFLEAVRQFGAEIGRENVVYIHLTLIPFIKMAKELKTKPTQHSVGKLREIGIQPDILLCRTEKPLSQEIKAKISLFCNVKKEAVIQALDITSSIYEIPLIYKEEGLDDIVIRHLNLKFKRQDFKKWKKLVERIKNPKVTVRVAVVGKYTQLQDAYKSIGEALTHGGVANEAKVEVKWLSSERIEKEDQAKFLEEVEGILVPGGFGDRGVEGKIEAIRWAREKKIPFLGICLGMQCAVIEFARNVCKLKGANSAEFDSQTAYPVIDLLPEQKKIKDLGGTMRLGAYPCKIKGDSLTFKAYRKTLVLERHRHRYEFNNEYRDKFRKCKMLVSGVSPNGKLVEIMELVNHPWFVACQFHPEFKSKPLSPHPLFKDFIKAVIKNKKR